MNPFTDDNLKQLKKVRENMQAIDKWDYVKILSLDLWALLARLEAAENCIPYHECQDDLSTCSHLQAWRKSGGK